MSVKFSFIYLEVRDQEIILKNCHVGLSFAKILPKLSWHHMVGITECLGSSTLI